MPKKYDAGAKVVNILSPRDAASAAAEGDWVSMENYDSVIFIYSSAAGAASQDVTVRVRQATSAVGAGAKNVAKGQWYAMQHASTLTDAFAAIGTAGSGAFGDDGETACIARIEITADELDTANDFNFVTVSVSDPGSTEKLQSVVAVLQGARYSVAVDEQPTALA